MWLARECMFPFKSPCNQLHLLRENKRKEAQVRVLKLCVFIVSSVRESSSSLGQSHQSAGPGLAEETSCEESTIMFGLCNKMMIKHLVYVRYGNIQKS
jgi:hypothetical protein